MKKLLSVILFLCCFSISALKFNYVYSAERIKINNSNFSKVKLAINIDESKEHAEKIFLQEMFDIISNDLQNSNLFEILNSQIFIENKYGVENIPHFPSWTIIKTNLILNISLKQTFNILNISFIIWDVILKKPIIKKLNLKVDKKDIRKISHYISDLIYEYSTGYEGYFNSRIVYVSESGKYKNRIKKLAIMDYDGYNHEYLTNGKKIVSSPRFFPDGKKILYMAYENKIPRVFIMDLQSKNSKMIGNFNNISFAPNISPNGKEIIMSIAQNGKSHIYEYNINSEIFRQLTFGDHINTSPCYSPCGKYIIFNSNRTNKRDLFIMRRSDNKVFKLTQDQGSYAEPKWSNKNWIAFTKMHRTLGFTIGILNISDKDIFKSERIIATAYLAESPAWNHNGRMLIFTKGYRLSNAKNKKFTEYNIKNLNKLCLIDAFGIYEEKIINTPEDASDADWTQTYVNFETNA
ncbi:MAG: PD40 domain-containing protein [Rickettsia sp.]|nr:PD40 domain-containing protein [Rickettsia sp.]